MANIIPIHGRICRIGKAGIPIEYSAGWGIQVAVDLADASSQGKNWKEFTVGQSSWTGSIDFLFVAGNTEQKALVDNLVTVYPGMKISDVQFVLDEETEFYIGDIFINSFVNTVSVGDTVKASFDFTGDDYLYLVQGVIWQNVEWQENIIWMA